LSKTKLALAIDVVGLQGGRLQSSAEASTQSCRAWCAAASGESHSTDVAEQGV